MTYAYMSWACWILAMLMIHLDFYFKGYPCLPSFVSVVIAHAAIAYGTYASNNAGQSLLLMLSTNIVGVVLYLMIMIKTRSLHG